MPCYVNRIPWAMQVRARACITRTPTSHPNSIVKHSFPMTKKESPNESRIVVFLAEKFVQIVFLLRISFLFFFFHGSGYHEYIKVHAKIQLLFFYELNSKRIRSRIICFSKSVCYLYDLFFRFHDQYYVSRTHNRLYHRRTLPD